MQNMVRANYAGQNSTNQEQDDYETCKFNNQMSWYFKIKLYVVSLIFIETNEKISQISALPSKNWLNQKSKDTLL